MQSAAPREPMRLGRYLLHGEIASGGMATVYFGRLMGPVGFSKVVAVKRMHPQFAKDPEFVAMFLDEASLASRIQHPNVVSTLDVVAEEGEIFIVLEYVRGDSLSALLRASRKKGARVPVPIAAALLAGALEGLHAAHEAHGERGEPLDIIHRDVSPQNILVGVDGLPRIVDFGVAKAASRSHMTTGNLVKGKVCYLAPEQLRASTLKNIDRGVDVFAAGAVLWEVLAGKRLFETDDPTSTIAIIQECDVPSLVTMRDDVTPELDAVVKRALMKDRAARFKTAEEFAHALERAAGRVASTREVGAWVREIDGDAVSRRDARVAEMESQSSIEIARSLTPGGGAISAPVSSRTPAPSSISTSARYDVTPPSISSIRSDVALPLPAPVPAFDPRMTPMSQTPAPIASSGIPPVSSFDTQSALRAKEARPMRGFGVALGATIGAAVLAGSGLAIFLSPRIDHASHAANAPPRAVAAPPSAIAPPPPVVTTTAAPTSDATVVANEAPATSASADAPKTSSKPKPSPPATNAASRSAATSPNAASTNAKGGGAYLPDRP